MKKILLSICFFSLFLILFTRPIQAKEPFITTATTTYTISEDGNTHAKLSITLENTSTNYYASSYSITLGFTHITNLQVSDDGGVITPTIEKRDTTQVVNVHFNKKSIGLGDKTTLVISFDTSDVATKAGNIWEVTIPGIADQESFDLFNVHVIVPLSFGSPAFIKPDTGIQNLASLQFTKEQIGLSGITISFGPEQTYHFRLQYHIGNNTVIPESTEIALPPTTNYQDVSIDSIIPPPSNVIMDRDGNWLAQYVLLPSQTKDIVVEGNTYVSLSPAQSLLSSSEVKQYLLPQPFWQSDNAKIQTLAKQLRTIGAIYEYVVAHLQYDFSRVTLHQKRLGALGILDNPTQAVCLEFTDLFVTLARAAGIPAREIDGYAYTQNAKDRPLSLVKDILHAWPEYYDTEKREWIMVDPTWENTTHGIDYLHVLDFDHFAFTIKGENSTYPIPAGGYKLTADANSKDVDIVFGHDEQPQTIPYSTSFVVPSIAALGDRVTGSITLQNIGHRLLPPQTITIDSPSLQPTVQTVTTPEVPPFGTVSVPIAVSIPVVLTNTSMTLTMHASQQTLKATIHIFPWWEEKFMEIGGGLFGSINTAVSFITERARHLFIPRKY